ncbi:MAG: hypothetical protein GY820_02535 [Gammaproteobacteria bacterium]|nr:hypothetical protein [Gammaproteobacteria bacterium]
MKQRIKMAPKGRNLTPDERKWILQEILARKLVCFGKHGDKLEDGSEITEQKKNAAWQEVYDAAAALDLPCCADGRNGTWIKNKTWPNLRDATKKKIDNRGQTGAEGGPESKWNELDDLVEGIRGKDSPELYGLGVSDSLQEVREGDVAAYETSSATSQDDEDEDGGRVSVCQCGALQQDATGGAATTEATASL